MAHFTVHENPNSSSKKAYPFMIDVQSPRLVIPLARKADFGNKAIAVLNPPLNVLGDDCLVLTQQMAAVRAGHLVRAVSDCAGNRHEILAAIDLLITGL